MILKALYDYYHRCDSMPPFGTELKDIHYLVVINKDGKFIRLEDCTIGKNETASFLVCRKVERTSAEAANFLYDKSEYAFGFPESDKSKSCFNCFKEKVKEIAKKVPDNTDIQALMKFYNQEPKEIISQLTLDPLWENIIDYKSKKSATKDLMFSFRIEGDNKIIAEKEELIKLNYGTNEAKTDAVCLITGNKCNPVETTSATMIPGSQATAKLVAFQVSSGYDSYGKEKGFNAPISEEAEFAYTTALKHLLSKESKNRFLIGIRTFVFWASSNNEAAQQAEDEMFNLFGFATEQNTDDPNKGIMQVRKVFEAIYNGTLNTKDDDKFYILGLAPNAARIAVVYWQETPLKDFAAKILKHFDDMEILDTRKEKKPYAGLHSILGAVTLGGKSSDATPNLPEAVVKSIFQGLPYPFTLYASSIRRILAEQNPTITRVAILKAYINRINNNLKITPMLDKENTNQGYLFGRLFATLVKIQKDANKIETIRERYMNTISSTPAAVFSTIMNLSVHHLAKLQEGKAIYYEKLKQEIIDKLSSKAIPTHLDLQDQGLFFIGYYHQWQDFFTGKADDADEKQSEL